MGGVKRAPSSLVQQTSSSARLVASPPVIQRAQNLEAGTARPRCRRSCRRRSACRDGCRSATGGRMVVAARAAGEDVAQAIDLDRAARLRAPGDEEIAHLLVLVGQGQPAQASGLAWSDLPRAHDGAPEPAGVDLDRRLACAHGPHHAYSSSGRDASAPAGPAERQCRRELHRSIHRPALSADRGALVRRQRPLPQPGAGARAGRADIDTSRHSVWRYAKALLVDSAHAVSLGEGWTPLMARRVGRRAGAASSSSS